MGLFGGSKNDTRAKIEELKAKMQGAAPQQQMYDAPPQQSWQPPAQQAPPPQSSGHMSRGISVSKQPEVIDAMDENIILDLGDVMSLNLPIKSRMRLDEFLHIADRVRELKRLEHKQQY